MNSQDTFAQLILKPHSRVTVRTDYHWGRRTFAGADANYGYLELMLRY